MVNSLTNAELAILGLLVEQPRHGYEIEQVITERGMRDWTEIGFSSIYYVLGRLETAGLVASSVAAAPGRGPARRVHAATPAGHAAWQAAALATLTIPTAAGRPFLVGLGNLAGLPPHAVVAALHAYVAALDERGSALETRRAEVAPAPWFVDAIFDYGEAMLRAERAWVAAFVDRIPTDPPNEEEPSVSAAPAATSVPSPARLSKMKPFVPELAVLPSRTMAVARTVGDPAGVGGQVFPALYGAVYGLKFALKKQGVEFKVEAPCARWFNGPDWKSVPREAWTAAWAIPVPDGTTELAQKDPAMPVSVETWEYGQVAQVLHLGTYAEEEPTILALHAFIAEQGLEIAGAHEEVYLSRPGATNQKTVVRYQVRPRG
jgi:DNA-binding PadR family transcriptional regulator